MVRHQGDRGVILQRDVSALRQHYRDLREE